VALLAGCDGSRTPAAPTGSDAPAPAAAETATETERPKTAPIGPIPIAEEAGRPLPPLEPPLSDHFQLIRNGRPDVARVRIRKHMRQHPDDGRAHFLFGLSYHREKRYDLARKSFDEAARLAPDYHATHYFQGWALYYLGEPEAARDSFERHLEFQPREGDSHFGLGLIALDMDDLDEAERRLRTAIVLSDATAGRIKEHSKSRARLADVLIRRGRYEEARTELERATELHPDHYEAFYKLFRVCKRLGDDAAAERAQTEFLAARERVHPGTSFPE
jgi:tetratricopeptide (TPR) repeat protein